MRDKKAGVEQNSKDHIHGWQRMLGSSQCCSSYVHVKTAGPAEKTPEQCSRWVGGSNLDVDPLNLLSSSCISDSARDFSFRGSLVSLQRRVLYVMVEAFLSRGDHIQKPGRPSALHSKHVWVHRE